ncbi:hypothetical protein BJY01DRAFT_31300 [Aspergillus pseudoustus]|uniref:Uncharacterized protein n=1 Tax=Aspergillus pseudoustus TaxID=1810923 RepID=A0ABR4KQE6_9EURO
MKDTMSLLLFVSYAQGHIGGKNCSHFTEIMLLCRVLVLYIRNTLSFLLAVSRQLALAPDIGGCLSVILMSLSQRDVVKSALARIVTERDQMIGSIYEISK